MGTYVRVVECCLSVRVLLECQSVVRVSTHNLETNYPLVLLLYGTQWVLMRVVESVNT